MKYLHNTLISVGIIILVMVITPIFYVSAETSDDLVQKTSETTQKVVATVRDTAMPWYEKIDSWRIKQNESWKLLKQEKEILIQEKEQKLEENRDNRVNMVLDEEQVSITTGAGKDLNTVSETFLLKLYVALLAVFIIIFSYPVLFYGIVIFILFSGISKIINKIRNPHAF